MTIRQLEPHDVGALAALSARVPTAPHWPVMEFTRLALLAAAEPDRRGAWIATLDGEPMAGFLFARRSADEVEIESLVTAPELRRQGIGTALLASAVEWARGLGASALLLECRASNQAALSLYARFAFAQDGLRRNYYRNPDEDALLLRLSLRGGPLH